MPDDLFVKFDGGRAEIHRAGVGYSESPPEIERSQVREENGKLTFETDLFASRPIHVLVRDKKLWAASSLRRLAQESDLPHGLLPLGTCIALCEPIARRPSLCASGLSLLPGTRTVCEYGRITTSTFWDAGRQWPVQAGSVQELGAQLIGKLKAAIARRVEGKRVALALSGGLDSAALLALLVEMGVSVSAYTMADSAAGGESDQAVELAKQAGVEINVVPIEDEALPELAAPTITACETLIYNARAMAKFAFYRTVAVKERVLLCGVGSDELLMGDVESLSFTRTGIPEVFARLAPQAEEALRLLRPEWRKRVKLIDWQREFAGKDPQRHARDVILRTMLPHAGLPVEMLAAAAHGLEVRAPFLDREFVAFAMGLPTDLLIRDGFGKWLLREALGERLPRSLRFANKQPRLSPAGGGDVRARRDWIAWLDRTLTFERLERLEVIDSGRVRRELIQYGKLHSEAPRRVLLDRVLMKLASLTVLQDSWAGPVS